VEKRDDDELVSLCPSLPSFVLFFFLDVVHPKGQQQQQQQKKKLDKNI
jgi:hypothetical protein